MKNIQLIFNWKHPKKIIFLMLFSFVFLGINAQEARNVIGYNLMPHIGSSFGNMEISYERVVYKAESSIIPVVVLGFNPGNEVNIKSYNATFDLQTIYLKLGLEANISNYEYMDKNRTFFQFLLGYSSNHQTANIKIKGNYFDDLTYKSKQNFEARMLQMFLLNESILNNQISLSYGIGFGMAFISNKTDPSEPIAGIGGHGFSTRVRAAADFYVNMPFKFSIHYQF